MQSQTANTITAALQFSRLTFGADKGIMYFKAGIPAGFPSPAADYLQKELNLNEFLIKHPAATFMAHVEGQSMRDANLSDGDIIIIDRAKTAVNKDIVVAILNGEFVVKRLKKTAAGVFLVPENPAYPTIEVVAGMDFEVWGVVLWVIRKAR